MSAWKTFAVCWIVCLLATRLEAQQWQPDGLFRWSGYQEESDIVSTDDATVLAKSIVPEAMWNNGVDVDNAGYVNTHPSGRASATFRDGNAIDIGFTAGAMMTTGVEFQASGPNNYPNTEDVHGSGPSLDTELQELAPFDPESQQGERYDVFDYATLVLPITWNKPVNVHVDYIFASEEYSEFVGSHWYDIMAVFVEQGIEPPDAEPDDDPVHVPLENTAVIPGLTAGTGAISVNGINGGVLVPDPNSDAEPPVEPSYPEYYNDNPAPAWPFYSPSPADFEYDGFTDVLTATAFGVTATTFGVPEGEAFSFDVKFGVGDVADGRWDCAIFIAEDSLWLEPVLSSQGTGGNWGSSSTWTEVSGYEPTPDANHAAVIGDHTVTVGADAFASSLRLDDGGDELGDGRLTVNTGTQLTVGTDVWVANGTLLVDGTLTADSNLDHGAGSELIIYSGSTVNVAPGGTLEITDIVQGGPTRDNRLLVAGGSLQVDGTLTTGTLLVQETGSQAVLTDSSTATVHRHIRVNHGSLTIDGSLSVLNELFEDENNYGPVYAVMVQGQDAQITFGPAASEQSLPSLEVAKGTLKTSRPLNVDESVGIGANFLYVMRDDPDTPEFDESTIPVATVRVRCNEPGVDVTQGKLFVDGDLTVGQTQFSYDPLSDSYLLYDAFVDFELDLISPPDDGSDPSLGVRIEAAGNITLRPAGSSQLQHTLRFRPNHLHPFKAGTIPFMVAGSGILEGDFAHETTGHIDVGLGTTGVYTQNWPVQISGGTAEVIIERDLCIGDADFSGSTDLSDFNIWNANKFTMPTDWSTADFNGDGQTDLSDFNIWNQYKFTSTSAMSMMMSPLGGEVLDVFYDPTSGELTVDTNGLNFQTMIIPGPEALSNDRWLDGTWEDNTIWVQQYFGGKEQWWGRMHIPGPLPDGQYQIATYEPGLTAADFGPVEYMVIEDILYVDVQILGGAQPPPMPVPVPEPGVVGLLLAAMAMAGLLWRRHSMVR